MQKNCRKKSSQQDPAYETQSEMAKFHEILADHGLYPDEIIFSKKIQRFSTNESPTDKAGYYQIFDNKNGLLGGFYGDWRTGLSGTWYSKNLSKFSPKDFKKIRTQIKKGKEEEAYLRKQLHEDAANNAKKIWNNSAPAQSKHLYLQKKRINSYGLHQDNEKLIIPAVNIDNIVQSIQYIYPDGKKLFLDNGKIKSHFFKINGKNDIIVLCEGYSTAASIYESTGYSVFASFSASNLLPVAQEIRFKYPKKRIIIAADNDQWKAINTGLVKGMEAAKKIQADFVVPNFKNITSKPNDFNDLHRLEGLDTVRNQINAAKTVVVENEPPFVCRHDGVYHLSTDAEEHILFEYVCSPVHVTAHTRNHDNENWGLLLEILDPDGKTHQWAMPMSMIAGNGDSYRSHLMHLGMRLGSAKNSKYLLYDYLMSSNAKKRVRCVSRIGWHGDSFILPNYNYGNSKEEVVLQTLPSDNLFCQSGTLEEWKSNIGKYCIANNRLQFVISLAFAAPFLEPMGSGSGGFNFVGDSSVGKSTLGKIAGSICGGGGINGYISSWRATDNAL
ncbi:DUF927 domain-containing protein, partial [Desulfoplanes sp. PS50]